MRAQILKLMQAAATCNLTYLFISHDLSVVEYVADRVAVMYVGRLVEMAGTGDLYHHPLHPYTEALMSAVPKPDPLLRSQRILLEGEIPDPSNPPPGCYFHPRCRHAANCGLCDQRSETAGDQETTQPNRRAGGPTGWWPALGWRGVG